MGKIGCSGPAGKGKCVWIVSSADEMRGAWGKGGVERRLYRGAEYIGGDA